MVEEHVECNIIMIHVRMGNSNCHIWVNFQKKATQTVIDTVEQTHLEVMKEYLWKDMCSVNQDLTRISNEIDDQNRLYLKGLPEKYQNTFSRVLQVVYEDLCSTCSLF